MGMILYRENTKEATTAIRTIYEFIKIVGYKINVQKWVVFLL